MSYNIQTTGNFNREASKLIQKHKKLYTELRELVNVLSRNPAIGKKISTDFYKLRLSFAGDKKKNNARLRFIVIMKISKENVCLFCIYEKGSKQKISNRKLKKMIRKFTS